MRQFLFKIDALFMNTAFFPLDLPTEPNDHKILGNVLQGADALAISEIAEQNTGLTVVVTPDTRSALRLSRVLAELSRLDVYSPIGKPCLTILFRPIKKLFPRV